MNNSRIKNGNTDGGNASAGQGVENKSNPIIDPTQNVLQLVDAAVTRLNDLRESDSKWLKQLQDAEARRIDEQMKLRAEFADRLSLAESKRINAIRAVDVGAVRSEERRVGIE